MIKNYPSQTTIPCKILKGSHDTYPLITMHLFWTINQYEGSPNTTRPSQTPYISECLKTWKTIDLIKSPNYTDTQTTESLTTLYSSADLADNGLLYYLAKAKQETNLQQIKLRIAPLSNKPNCYYIPTHTYKTINGPWVSESNLTTQPITILPSRHLQLTGQMPLSAYPCF